MAAAALVFMVASTAMKMKGEKDASRETRRQLTRRKEELERNAKTVRAVAQREGFEEERKAKIIASRAQALAAFSGAGATDTTVSEVIADITGEGEYRRNVAVYGGAEDARRMLLDAEEASLSEQAERKASRTRQLTSLFELGASAYGKYGSESGSPAQGYAARTPAPAGRKGWGYD